MFDRLKRKIPSRRDVRYLWQRLTRGWDDSETWSLDYSLAKLILPRLKRFQEIRGGHPAEMTDQEWNDILKEMIGGFEFLASDDRWACPENDIRYQKAQAAIELFSKYYLHLWT